MQNLVEHVKKIFINNISVFDFGAYLDSITSNKVLLFKKFGLSIPFVPGLTLVPAVTCTDNGVVKSQDVCLDTSCPCNPCDIEFGIEIKKVKKQPGVLNSFVEEAHFYGGVMDKVECTGNVINEEYLVEMENEIINQITADVPTVGTESGSIVNAYKKFTVVHTIITVATDSIDYEFYDANNTLVATVTLNDTHTTLALVLDAFNNDPNFSPLFEALPIEETATTITFAIISHQPGMIYSMDYTLTGTPTDPVISHCIALKAKSPEVKFEVLFESNFANKSNTGLYKLKYLSNQADALTITANNTSHLIPSGASAVLLAGIINGLNIAGLRAEVPVSGSAEVWVYSTDEVQTLSIVIQKPVAVEILSAQNPTGTFPTLTSEDVFRESYNVPPVGAAAQMVYMNKPLPNTPYCKYLFTWTQNTPDLVGANHLNQHTQHIALYIKKDQLIVDCWDGTTPDYMAETGFVPNADFVDLITYWTT